jgi:hypothetical protein
MRGGGGSERRGRGEKALKKPWKNILLLSLLKKLDNSKRSGVAVDCEFDIHAQVPLCPFLLAWESHVEAGSTSVAGFKTIIQK